MVEFSLPLDRILTGDCVEVMNTLPEQSIDLIFADPPYNLQLNQELWRPNMTKVDAVDDAWDQFSSFSEYDQFTRDWLQACRRVLKDNGAIWVIGSYHNIFRVGKILMDLGYWILNDVAWIKCLAGHTKLFARINGYPIVSSLKDLVRINLSKNSVQLPSFDDNGCFSWVNLMGSQKFEKSRGVRILLEDGSWVECTPQHLFPVARIGEVVMVSAEHLVVGDTLIQLGHFDMLQGIVSEAIDRELGEFIGWYLAEGSFQMDAKGIQLSMSAEERSQAEDLIRLIQRKFGVVGRIHIYGNSLHLIFPGRFMVELVKRFVRGASAHTKHLARDSFAYGKEFLEGILTGYLLGDGHWNELEQRWRLGLARNANLVSDLGVICRVLGYRLRFSETHVPYKRGQREIYRGEIRENQQDEWSYISLEVLGLPSRGHFAFGQRHSLGSMRRKYKLITRKNLEANMPVLARQVIEGDLRLITIKSITQSTLRTFYDVAVDGNHIFALANGLLTHNSNPMPNFRGVRFTNAHETLIWAKKSEKGRYTFNYHLMKELNGGKQMRSDWEIPICSGSERIKVDGSKAHSTQKPEALLERVIFSSSNPGDVVLDPFFGSGTTGAVAKRLGRHWIGIERDARYVQVANKRIETVQLQLLPEVVAYKRTAPRVAFPKLLQQGLIHEGQILYFRRDESRLAQVTGDGELRSNGTKGSIHQVGSFMQGGSPCNGWEHWYFKDENGELKPIDVLREMIRQNK